MDLILAYLSFPYEKIDDANKKYLEMLNNLPRMGDLFEPKPIQQTMPWYSEDSVKITTIFGVKKGKLKEALEFLNFRKNYWPKEEGYRLDVWITVQEGKKPPSVFGEKYLIFVSYATKDAEMFKIGEMTKKLTNFPEIKNVLYWQEHMHDNIFKFMNDNLGKCDVMLLFCSKNSLNSIPVEKEWTAAEAIGIPIIPIFFDVVHIPPLLKSRLGIEYDFNDMDKNLQELRALILIKIKGVTH
ncbi:MAG: TIR domain-containing protein [Candidatus Hodarchaeota archaeon]